MHNRAEWTKGSSGPQVLKGKTYANLVEFTRPCATCSKPFSIFVTAKIANGHADSNSFGLKNCEEHRRNKSPADLSETDRLRTANATMKEELDGLYDTVRDLRERLAKYELPAAMEVLGQEQKVTAIDSDLPKSFPWV